MAFVDRREEVASMSPSGIHSSSSFLYIEGPATAFCSEGESLKVPAEIAKRSILIHDLRQQAHVDESIPLMLSLEDLRSWLTCCAALVESAEGVNSLMRLSDHTLLQALTAADFLCDAATIASLVESLGRVVLPDAEIVRYEVPTEPASAAVRDRATTVVESLPHGFVLRVLASIHERFRGAPGSSEDHTLRLLQRLPRTFHPAIFQTCCRDPESHSSFFVGCPQWCCRSCFELMAANNWLPDGPNPDCLWRDASPVFQLLAAAAPLAGGSLAAAWDPDDSADDSPAAAGEATQPPSAKRLCAMPQDAADRGPHPGPHFKHSAADCEVHDWKLAHGSVSQLSIYVQVSESPRWCRALAQLRHLQHLAVTLPDAFPVLGAKLAAALQRLPALRSLEVTYDEDWRSGGSAVLLEGISTCTQLHSLKLKAVRPLPSVGNEHSQHVPHPDTQAVNGFSRLCNLTCLSISSDAVTPAWAAAASIAVKGMRQLESLSLALSNNIDKHAAAAESLAVDLFAAPQLAALRHVSFSGLLLGPLDSDDDGDPPLEGAEGAGAEAPRMLPVSSFRERALQVHGAALTRLSALGLSGNWIDGATQGAKLVALLTAMPALRSLDLSHNNLKDIGFVSLAGMLCAGGLPALVRLDVGLNHAEEGGVIALVTALGDAAAAGAANVQELDLSGNTVDPDVMEPLAAAIQRCRGLEVLQLRGMGLALTHEGLKLLHGALAALPRLRLVCLSGNRERFDGAHPSTRYFSRSPQPLSDLTAAVTDHDSRASSAEGR